MITSIAISGFKRFYRNTFDLAPLTVLAGLNGSGKTSLIQALLLMWEASLGDSGSIVRLNGPFGLELGNAGDIRNWRSDELIELTLGSSEGIDSVWKFGVPSEDALYATVEARPGIAPVAFSGAPRAFTYLSAERLGPRSSLGGSPRPATEIEVGVRGEFCAQLLDSLGDKKIEDVSRLHPDSDREAPSLLKYEVEKWLAQIARPVEIDAIRYAGSSVFALRFRMPGGDWVNAPNMGFGLTYSLPIILAGLTCKADGLLIVENPESHLHPAGQSRIGTFLAWLAGHGVQVILETHSDHVLNGIRRAIGEFKYLSSDQATVHFFEASADIDLITHKLDFNSIGGMSDWPAGFFDQYQTDVSSLGRIRRGN